MEWSHLWDYNGIGSKIFWLLLRSTELLPCTVMVMLEKGGLTQVQVQALHQWKALSGFRQLIWIKNKSLWRLHLSAWKKLSALPDDISSLFWSPKTRTSMKTLNGQTERDREKTSWQIESLRSRVSYFEVLVAVQAIQVRVAVFWTLDRLATWRTVVGDRYHSQNMKKSKKYVIAHVLRLNEEEPHRLLKILFYTEVLVVNTTAIMSWS